MALLEASSREPMPPGGNRVPGETQRIVGLGARPEPEFLSECGLEFDPVPARSWDLRGLAHSPNIARLISETRRVMSALSLRMYGVDSGRMATRQEGGKLLRWRGSHSRSMTICSHR